MALELLFKGTVNVKLDHGLQRLPPFTFSHSAAFPHALWLLLTAAVFGGGFGWSVKLIPDKRRGDAYTHVTVRPHKNIQALIDGPFWFVGLLHLFQDPRCLHSDPQRMVVQQLEFIHVLFYLFQFCLLSILNFFSNISLERLCRDLSLAEVIGVHLNLIRYDSQRLLSSFSYREYHQ